MLVNPEVLGNPIMIGSLLPLGLQSADGDDDMVNQRHRRHPLSPFEEVGTDGTAPPDSHLITHVPKVRRLRPVGAGAPIRFGPARGRVRRIGLTPLLIDWFHRYVQRRMTG